MNQLQLAIVGVIVGIIVIIIAYHFYQEHKFKKNIDMNFNRSSNDALQNDNGLVFENQQHEQQNKIFTPFERDVTVNDNLAVENNFLATEKEDKPIVKTVLVDNQIDDKFVDYDAIQFDEFYSFNYDYKHVVDIKFAKPTKIKLFPDLGQYTTKKIHYFILEKNVWLHFERNKKYLAEGVKIIVDLVDSEGCIYPLQLNNIYNELSKFATHHNAIIREQDSELKIRKIQQQLKNLSQSVLELELFMVNKENLSYRELAKYFVGSGFIERNGFFEYCENNKVVCYIASEEGKRLDVNGTYRLFSFNAKLHHQEEPMYAVNKIFDIAEDYMQHFESRLLTSNKMLMSERDYNALERQINHYISGCKRQNIVLGSELLRIVHP